MAMRYVGIFPVGLRRLLAAGALSRLAIAVLVSLLLWLGFVWATGGVSPA